MGKNNNEYYLGLDIGTDSVGWAVTDLDYNIQKFNGKAMWGIRLFEAGETAAERRVFRTTRRRIQRRKQRIELLQELFDKEIAKVDPQFFLRLKESKYWVEDRTLGQVNILFNDGEYTDKDYYKDYPTIYHLRKELMESDEAHDVRLVYLVIHHIIKNRGHFLFEGEGRKDVSSFPTIFKELCQSMHDEMELELEAEDLNQVEAVLKNRENGINDKKTQLNKLLTIDDDHKKDLKAIIALLAGGKAKVDAFFGEKTSENSDVKDLTFVGGKFEENFDALSTMLGDKMFCLEKMKAIYDWSVLEEILQGKEYLSYAKVATYEKHKSDLVMLKRVIRKYRPEEYDACFKDPKGKSNFCAYVGMAKKGKKKLVIEKKCSQEDLCKYLSKVLGGIAAEDQELQYILSEIQRNVLLPKQVNKDNGVIPNQLHREELSMILNHAEKYLPFFKIVDESGFSVREKIEKILTFRIPYYVGPLNAYHKSLGHCWIVKNKEEKIYPWNFDEVVNLEESATAFIRKMTSKCTYVIGADVVPKNSLLYSEFMVLNELNNVKVNGEELPIEIKGKAFEEVFKKIKRVTGKRLRDFLIAEGAFKKGDELSGFDQNFKGSLTSYLDFKRILGDRKVPREAIEGMIQAIVLFGDDRKLLRRRIQNGYGELLSKEEVAAICKLKYMGWGRLSKEFLEEIYHVDHKTGEMINIIAMMHRTNDNLMQLLSSQYRFTGALEEKNREVLSDNTDIAYSIVKDLYVSPAVRRSIWQSLKIVKEIAKIKKTAPKKVFVEVARENGEKKRTVSRKNALIALYKNCKEEERDWQVELEAKTDHELRRDRLYLYYTQMGRCMYTGNPIDLNRLFDVNIYDVDHIFPQSKIKDDSLANRVLVERTVNANKSDVYPLPEEIRNKNRSFWTMLYKKELISKRKYDRLTRVTPFTDSELADFIARQLVETRQSTKAVAQVLKQVFPETDVVYVKAGNVSDFRHKYKLIKVREVNNYHHAKDAYLNIVVGNVYDTKFTKSPLNFIQGKGGKNYSLNRMYDFDVERAGIVAWKKGNEGSLKTVRRFMKKNNILFTRHAFEVKGGLFDQTIMKKGKGQVPIKGGDERLSDISKYGGYNKVSGAYFFLVEHTVKKKRIRTLEFAPVYLAKKMEDQTALLEFCTKEIGLVEPRVLVSRVKINTMFEIDGFKMHISGRTGNSILYKCGEQLVTNYEDEQYLKGIGKYLGRVKVARKELPINEHDKINAERNFEIYNLYLSKLKSSIYNVHLDSQIKHFENGKEKFEKLSLLDQCQVLNNTLNLFKCTSDGANLSLIGAGAKCGRLLIGKNITLKSRVYIVNQSITGLFEQKVDLLAI
jgi:CRISPR-associated endonuclease Csn1